MIIENINANYEGKDKAYYVDLFLRRILDKVPYYEYFELYKLRNQLDLTDNQKEIFNELTLIIDMELRNRRLVSKHPIYQRQLMLTDGAKDYYVLRESRLKAVKQNYTPIKKSSKIAKVWDFYSKHPTWSGVIATLIAAFIIWILGQVFYSK